MSVKLIDQTYQGCRRDNTYVQKENFYIFHLFFKCNTIIEATNKNPLWFNSELYPLLILNFMLWTTFFLLCPEKTLDLLFQRSKRVTTEEAQVPHLQGAPSKHCQMTLTPNGLLRPGKPDLIMDVNVSCYPSAANVSLQCLSDYEITIPKGL